MPTRNQTELNSMYNISVSVEQKNKQKRNKQKPSNAKQNSGND